MRVLVVGGGGREHALVEALAASPENPELFAAPGNPGIAKLAQTVDIPANDLVHLRDFARDNDIDLAVVGPEAPLIDGISEAFWEVGVKTFGPTRAAARIEGSKVFAKEVMHHAGVPTARFEAFDGEAAALAYLRSLPRDDLPVVVKVDGLAAGKGVTIARTHEEAEGAVRAAFGGAFGMAGERVVIEEFLVGREASVFVLTDGRQSILPFLPAQDYKRAYDGNEGPNTGGMGAYSPVGWMEPATYAAILEEIIGPVVHQLALLGVPYTGLLYAGVIVTDEGPKALEFNCRFGDPETQAIMPRLKSDLIELLEATIDGSLDEVEIEWDERPAVTVVMASGGYPGSYEPGKPISGLAECAGLPDVHVFHAGTRPENGNVVTSGGRVLGVTALGDDVEQARARAYEGVARISFEGSHFRRDIAVLRGSA